MRLKSGSAMDSLCARAEILGRMQMRSSSRYETDRSIQPPVRPVAGEHGRSFELGADISLTNKPGICAGLIANKVLVLSNGAIREESVEGSRFGF